MDLSYGPEYEEFRSEVRDFLASSWPLKGAEAELERSEQMVLFRQRAIERGFLCRNIPKKYGGSEQEPDVLTAQILREESADPEVQRSTAEILNQTRRITNIVRSLMSFSRSGAVARTSSALPCSRSSTRP